MFSDGKDDSKRFETLKK